MVVAELQDACCQGLVQRQILSSPLPAHASLRPTFCLVQAALDKLPGELKAQQANAAAVERRLQREKGAWVAPEGRDRLPREFVQARPPLVQASPWYVGARSWDATALQLQMAGARLAA